ncbi:hypothetical protein NQ318_005563 [Aromia moschata]|uniref:Mos1 transposase HTH domain-containing protein n=1 Tax=Aromia moschata TaxID=1265417 RepID=A0AAV8XGV7_9CUCU|nr:hypothetical protein NQ318_005563 [Aromia moschata]
MEGSLEQRYAIKFCVRLGKNATETFQMLQEAFKDDYISRSQSGRWHKAFKEGRKEVVDEHRETVNAALYLEVLRRLKRRLVRVRADIKDAVKLHHDNAPSHTAFIITNFLARSSTPVVSQPLTDYPSYYSKIPNVKSSYMPIQNAKKSKKTVQNYVTERKCPIYVHHFNRIANPSMYNNYSVKTVNKNSPEKPYSSKNKKAHSHNPKSVLDQLEETYWASWKPNKENNKHIRIRGNEDSSNKNKAYGDASETLVKYFATSDFNTSTMSVIDDSRGEKLTNAQKLELINPQIMPEIEKCSQKLVITSTQEIQTDGYPLILPKIEEQIESGTNLESVKNNSSAIYDETAVEESENVFSEVRHNHAIDIEDGKSDVEDESKVLKHTDSFIITKKKQNEVKERFQQPKCIKLYKKPGTSTSFIRGGSYPLKSCLKCESAQKVDNPNAFDVLPNRTIDVIYGKNCPMWPVCRTKAQSTQFVSPFRALIKVLMNLEMARAGVRHT